MKGLGIDLCSIARIEEAAARSERFLHRWFTQEERDYFESRGKTAMQSAAAAFAAKEAFLKAVGLGIGRGIALQEIAVVHDEFGAPQYALSGAARQILQEMGAQHAWLSISHENDTAAAICVID